MLYCNNVNLLSSLSIPLFLLFGVSFFLNLVTIIWLRKKLLLWNFVDIPGDRRIHNVVTPRGAGLALVIVFIISLVGFEYYTFNTLSFSFKLILPFALISIISFIDDIKGLSILIRLIFHFVSTVLVLYFFLFPKTLFHEELPSYIDSIITIIGFVAFLNIFNFLDGIDGITSIESIHISITLMILCYIKYDIILNVDLVIIISVIVFSFSVAFLIFNCPPASIFIGDVGSISLGFIIGFCLILLSVSSWHLFASSIITCLYYIADGGITILIRLMQKEKIWQPHLKHFFQRAVKNGYTQKQVITRIAICNFCLMLLAVNAVYYPVISTVLAILVTGITLINFAK